MSKPVPTKEQMEERFSTPGEITLHWEAVKTFQSIADSIRKNGKINPEDFVHFKPRTTPKSYSFLQAIILEFSSAIVRFEDNSLIKKKIPEEKKQQIRRIYNQAFNKLKGQLESNTILNNLLLIDSNLRFMRVVVRQRERIDCLFGVPISPILSHETITKTETKTETEDPDPEENSRLILRVKGDIGGRVVFESAEHALSAMRSFIQNTSCDDINIIAPEYYNSVNNKKSIGTCGILRLRLRGFYSIQLKIRFPPYNKDSKYIYSNDNGLTHILCGGKPLNTRNNSMDSIDPSFRHVYPIYSEYLDLLYQRIKQLINLKYQDGNFPFMILSCCKSSCGYNSIVAKPDFMNTKMSYCEKCDLDLCAGGCGRVFHGETDCTLSLDEASELVIKQTSMNCPGCRTACHKIDGCNHMTCTCGIHFCYQCGQQLELGRVTEHYRDTEFGVPGSLCDQFTN